ncbi:MAG TPA: MipA/OmpV family protein [Steroidobacteraceae bacterium]|nr:MipA/OmpV family protein [Steroidobacteraceae bacterium]
MRQRATRQRALLGACGVVAVLGAFSVHAEEKPLWEFGLGVGAIAFPDYRGSDETHVYPVPVPYFVYRGEFLKADREGLRGLLFDREFAELSISADATIPVNSEDNAARRGMPDLKPTVELGPSLEVHLWHNERRTSKLDVVLPLRVPVTLESSPRSLQWIFAPRLNIDFADFAGHTGWNFGAGVGPVFAAERFHDYYYSVPARFATPTRPEYRADGGYSGMHVLAALSKRFPKYWVGAFLRYDWLAGAQFEDSPLVRREHSLAGGFGIAWMIGESKRKVEAD